MARRGFIYLASCYTHKDAQIQQQRHLYVCKAAAALMEQGHCIFSPLTHTVPMEDLLPKRLQTFQFWMNQDLPILRQADELWVLQLPGWETSRGVQAEIKFAFQHEIPIKYITYDECMRGLKDAA